MQFAVIGLNHHSATVNVRECAAIPSEEKIEVCRALTADGSIDEVVVLSTCNRTELYLGAADVEQALATGRRLFDHRCSRLGACACQGLLYTARDLPAARHLFEVTTSLDSLVVGEPHIIGQVRDDFERAQEAGTVGKLLNRLFFRSLEVGKAVRAQTEIGESPVSVSSIALDLAARVFGSIGGRTVLVLGAGEMGRQTAILAEYRGAGKILISNRSPEKATQLAQRVGGELYNWDNREKAMIQADVIVTSTGSPEPIIGHEQMARVMQLRRNRPVFLIDIAVPRDVEEEVDGLYNLYRYDLDDLNEVARDNEVRRQSAVPAVREMIEDALKEFDNWCKELNVVPTIVNLRERVESIRKNEVDAHLRRMHSLDDRDRNLVEAMSMAIVNKLLHAPTVRLKEAATRGADRDHVESLRYLFDLDERSGLASGDDDDRR